MAIVEIEHGLYENFFSSGKHDVFLKLERASIVVKEQLVQRGNYSLFQAKDATSWFLFLVVFLALIVFDNFVLHRKAQTISFSRAVCYSIFWTFCGLCWNIYVYYHRGYDDALSWSTGYLLEWMLSMDCLFFFHIIFKMLGTPDHLKQIPLFWGIALAILFRMVFFLLEEVMMHSFYWTHLVFGAFLIYTGVKSATLDDEHFDPRENALFKFACKYIRLVNGYDNDGSMFVKVRVDPATGEPIVPASSTVSLGIHPSGSGLTLSGGKTEKDLERTPIYSSAEWYSGAHSSSGRETYQWRGTLLVVVVLCILITDLIFAVDSVSAVVAEIPDLFLAYTASVFAVLNLRAMFFVTDQLIKLFVLLKYGIAAILCIIGVKLMLKERVDIPSFVILIILISIVTLCILGSLLLNYLKKPRNESVQAP